MKPRLLFVVNELSVFISHRLSLAVAAQAHGFEVHVASPASALVDQVLTQNITHHTIRLGRRSTAPWRELLTIYDLWRLYRIVRPSIVHQVTIKPVIYGSIAARLASVPGVVNAITGLGYVFIGSDSKARLLRRVVEPAYRLALGHANSRVIFQNPHDQNLLVSAGICRIQQARLIKGTGVDMALYAATTTAVHAPLMVLLPARMLWDKGVGEFVIAARLLKQTGIRARFVLAGAVDKGNPSAIAESQLRDWQQEGVVEWLGLRNDMPQLLGLADIVCLPSYREGLPRVLIEAAACGKPLVATNVPGCSDIVTDGENGLLVPVRDAAALANALNTLLQNAALRQRMGSQARRLVVQEYAIANVNRKTLTLYDELMQNQTVTYSGKRAMDVLLAGVGMAMLLLPMVLIALTVKLTSKGPVLYWSDRVGQGNILFSMPKFRTMRVDTPAVATHLLNDPKRYLTPIGGLLRKTSLDELPQIWSILKGDMSWVGPRPALFNQDDLVALRTECGVQRLLPGLTGWAQVNGRDELPIPVKVGLDADYLRDMAFSTDIKILLMTFLKVLRRDGIAH